MHSHVLVSLCCVCCDPVAGVAAGVAAASLSPSLTPPTNHQIRNAHQIIVLSDGQIAEQGTHDELVEQPGGIYHRMWNAQRKANNAVTQIEEQQQ